jgi:hypothetical protein
VIDVDTIDTWLDRLIVFKTGRFDETALTKLPICHKCAHILVLKEQEKA